MSAFKFCSELKIGQSKVAQGQPTYIIAEAGVNHNGKMELAYQLVDVAVDAGANAVKFQLFHTEELILQDVEKAPYQQGDAADEESQYQMLKGLEISIENCRELKAYCEKKGITFLVTPFDLVSLAELKNLGLDALKISSTDLTNTMFLQQAASFGIPVILSTGMSEKSEVERALATIQPVNNQVVLLQCTSSYPAPESQIQLSVINRYKQDYQVLVGYSDHSVGIGVSPYAVAAGAMLIEKHFTLDKSLPGPDHQASLSPEELKEFVVQIRQVDMMMGDGIKAVQLCEEQNRKALQKSLVASCFIGRGELFTSENLVAKRTGGEGISSVHSSQILGLRASTDFAPGELIDV